MEVAPPIGTLGDSRIWVDGGGKVVDSIGFVPEGRWFHDCHMLVESRFAGKAFEIWTCPDGGGVDCRGVGAREISWDARQLD